MTQFTITVLAVTCYSMIAGLTRPVVVSVLRPRCKPNRYHNRTHNSGCTCGTMGTLCAIFWPLGVFLGGGYLFGERISKKITTDSSDGAKTTRLERKRKAELDALDHKLEVAKKEQEHTAMLEQFAHGSAHSESRYGQ